MIPQLVTLLIVCIAIFILVSFGVFFSFLSIWTRAITSGAYVPFFRILGMKLRRVNPHYVIPEYIRSVKAELGVDLDELEVHYIAGGDVQKAMDLYLKVRRRGIEVPFKTICDTELAGYDLDHIDPSEFARSLPQ